MAFWKSEKVIKEIERSSGMIVVKAVENDRGNFFTDIRFYFLSNDYEWFPTKKGIAIPYELIDDVIEALEQAKEQLET